MGTDIQSGINFVDGNLYHDAEFNAAINNSTILPTAISARTLKDDMSLGDELLINDNGTLKKVSGQQIVKIAVVPSGCMMDYAGATEPLGWVFCYGQALSRTTYAALFTAIGTAYGTGDGSTTFNVPDCRGRISAGDDNMGGTAANRITTAGSGLDGTVLGAAGGSQSISLTTAHMPAHSHTTTNHTHTGVTDHLHEMDHYHYMQGHSHTYNEVRHFPGNLQGGNDYRIDAGQTTGGPNTPNTGYGSRQYTSAADRPLSTGGADRALTTDSVGSGSPYTNLQPTIILNKIIKT